MNNTELQWRGCFKMDRHFDAWHCEICGNWKHFKDVYQCSDCGYVSEKKADVCPNCEEKLKHFAVCCECGEKYEEAQ